MVEWAGLENQKGCKPLVSSNLTPTAKLRFARQEAGKLLKKPQAYISKIERGERGVDAVELAEFAKVYNKDINYFIK